LVRPSDEGLEQYRSQWFSDCYPIFDSSGST